LRETCRAVRVQDVVFGCLRVHSRQRLSHTCRVSAAVGERAG
jgi:hypothetical protein